MDDHPGAHPVRRSPENDEIYRYARAEMQTELALINARVNWLITSQAFLFVPLVLGAKGASVAQSVFFPYIPHLGIALCLLVLSSVLAAVWRSLQWRAKWSQGEYAGGDAHGRFSIIAPHTPLIPVLGMIGALGVPVVLTSAWVWLRLWPPG